MVKNTSSFLEPPNYVWQNYTPTWTQSVAIAKTVNWARYVVTGKWVQVSIRMTATSAGTASNKILVGLPIPANANNFIMGQLLHTPPAGTSALMRVALYDTASSVAFSYQYGSTWTNLSARWGDATIVTTLANNDVVNIYLSYEAA